MTICTLFSFRLVREQLMLAADNVKDNDDGPHNLTT
jgi:hypothetical protein